MVTMRLLGILLHGNEHFPSRKRNSVQHTLISKNCYIFIFFNFVKAQLLRYSF